jgi:hypothetical protein
LNLDDVSRLSRVDGRLDGRELSRARRLRHRANTPTNIAIVNNDSHRRALSRVARRIARDDDKLMLAIGQYPCIQQ